MAEETPGGCPCSQAWARHLLRLRGLLRARGRERRRVLRSREAAQLLRQLRLRGPTPNMSAPAPAGCPTLLPQVCSTSWPRFQDSAHTAALHNVPKHARPTTTLRASYELFTNEPLRDHYASV